MVHSLPLFFDGAIVAAFEQAAAAFVKWSDRTFRVAECDSASGGN
jgi:hypothetical protein